MRSIRCNRQALRPADGTTESRLMSIKRGRQTDVVRNSCHQRRSDESVENMKNQLSGCIFCRVLGEQTSSDAT